MTMRRPNAPASTGRPAGLTMALWAGPLAGLLGAAAVQAAGDAALPERSLKVQLRCAADAPVPGAAPAPRASDRVVGTSRLAPGVTIGTSHGAISGQAPIEVIVVNGQAAVLRWSGSEAAWDVAFDAAWTTAPAGRPPRTTQGGEALLALRLVKRVHALEVQPHWLGGDRPVRVEVRLSTGEAATGAPALHTRVHVPLDRWTSLGRLLPPDATAGIGGCALQLRVLLQP